MNPQILAALLSFAPTLFGGMFGDPNKKLRKQVAKLTSAQNLGRQTDQFYQQALGSPAFAQAQGGIAAGANQTQANLARNLGARGLGTTGSAAIMSSLIPSLVGSQQAGLRTAAHNTAQQQAQQNIKTQLETLLGTQGPSPTQQLLAGGLESFLPYLKQILAQRGPGGMNQGAEFQYGP